MTEAENGEELSQLETFINFTRSELELIRSETTEIGLLVEQSQGEVDKLAQRNDSIIATLHQIQSNFDTVPREDIRSTYEAFQDVLTLQEAFNRQEHIRRHVLAEVEDGHASLVMHACGQSRFL